MEELHHRIMDYLEDYRQVQHQPRQEEGFLVKIMPIKTLTQYYLVEGNSSSSSNNPNKTPVEVFSAHQVTDLTSSAKAPFLTASVFPSSLNNLNKV